MKFKHIFMLLTASLASCVGLEQYPTNSFTDQTFWQYPENVRAALYLAYNQCWDDYSYFHNDLLSDDTYGSRHSADELSIATGLATTSCGRFSREWNNSYQELRTIHTSLDNQDRIDVGDEAFKQRMLAELRLMRAFTYLRLTTWFGNVPFYTKNPTLAESISSPRTDEKTIKEFIHSELEAASHVLPRNTELAVDELGRYTAGTAVALNARAYLLDNDFENCARECEKLIRTTDYGTYALAEDYDALFKTGEYGSESIMTIEYATLDGVNNVVRSWGTGSVLPQSIGAGEVVMYSPTQELVDAFRKTDGSVAGDTDYLGRDKRFYATIAYNGCTIEIPEARNLSIVGSQGQGKGTYTCWTKGSDESAAGDNALKDSYNGTQNRTVTGYYNLKNYNPRTINKDGNSYKSLIEIRYADVLLMYAESMYELGRMDEQVWDETIRPLRERAGFTADYCSYASAAGDMRRAIRDERRCELALEGRRAFDLRRWAVLDNAAVKTAGSAVLTSQATGAPFESDGSNIKCQNPYKLKYWFAIPQGERDKNKNLTQNPGW